MNALITANFDTANLKRLEKELNLTIDYRPIGERDERLSTSELKAALKDVEILIVGYEGVSQDVLDAATDLKVIACARGGPEANIDISAATERGIPVLYAPGRNATSVADYTWGMIFAAARNIARGHHLLHTGTYTGVSKADSADGGEREDVTWGVARGSPYMDLKGVELAGKTLGIIGLGAIGRKVATRAQGFEMDLLGFDPFIDADEMASVGVQKVDLENLCAEADFVTVHCPVTETTRGLIGKDEFALMSEAYFINTARGAIVDQDALLAALRSDSLSGAALDVYDEEPLPEDHPLLNHPNVVTTPHLAGAAREVISRHATMLTNDLAALLSDEQPSHLANESALDSDLLHDNS